MPVFKLIAGSFTMLLVGGVGVLLDFLADGARWVADGCVGVCHRVERWMIRCG